MRLETSTVELINPKDSTQTAKILATYQIITHSGRSHMSNGDIGYPTEYQERLVDWDYLPVAEEECPEWLTKELVQQYCEE